MLSQILNFIKIYKKIAAIPQEGENMSYIDTIKARARLDKKTIVLP